MPVGVYPDVPPGAVMLPRPEPGTFTVGPAQWSMTSEVDEEVSSGVEVSNPPFLGLWTLPTATWSGQAVLGGLFRPPYNDWATRVTSAGESPDWNSDAPLNLAPPPDMPPEIDKDGADVTPWTP